MDGCEICVLLKTDEQDVVLITGKYWRVVLDPNQEYLGKTFVTLRKHKEMLSELEKDEWLELAEITAQLEPAIASSFSPTHFNWACLMNNAIRDGQPTHLHWHCQPRYKTLVEFAGRTFIDSRWPESARTVNPHLVSADTLQAIKKSIVANIE